MMYVKKVQNALSSVQTPKYPEQSPQIFAVGLHQNESQFENCGRDQLTSKACGFLKCYANFSRVPSAMTAIQEERRFSKCRTWHSSILRFWRIRRHYC
jgi:hypothetical protein